jgi:hypothetical protein
VDWEIAMSRGSRWTIGFFAGLTGILMILVGMSADSSKIGIYFFAGFCLCIAVMCFVPSTTPVLGRFIGLTLFTVCLWYLLQELFRKQPDPNGTGSVWGATKAMLIFGLPGAYVAVRGRMPGWSKFSSAFHQTDLKDELR